MYSVSLSVVLFVSGMERISQNLVVIFLKKLLCFKDMTGLSLGLNTIKLSKFLVQSEALILSFINLIRFF